MDEKRQRAINAGLILAIRRLIHENPPSPKMEEALIFLDAAQLANEKNILSGTIQPYPNSTA